MADSGDDVLEEVARALGVELAEAQRVEDRDRPRAEREDVAEDAADAGGGALERLDRARVVVRLDLEGDRPAVADRDRAGVLARAHQHARALGRQPAQELARMLVGAVLGPQQAEHRQLDVVRLAAELLDDQLELGVGESELAVLGKRCGRARSSDPADVGVCHLRLLPRRPRKGGSRWPRLRCFALRRARAARATARCGEGPGPDRGHERQRVGADRSGPDPRRAGRANRVAMRVEPEARSIRSRPATASASSGEVQVSTTCVVQERRCIGELVSAEPDREPRRSCSRAATSRRLPTSPSRGRLTVLCKQHRPNRNHHCTLAIPNTTTVIPRLSRCRARRDHCTSNCC